jgi:hypothetical protein
MGVLLLRNTHFLCISKCDGCAMSACASWRIIVNICQIFCTPTLSVSVTLILIQTIYCLIKRHEYVEETTI